jgi:hypothetical protein
MAAASSGAVGSPRRHALHLAFRHVLAARPRALRACGEIRLLKTPNAYQAHADASAVAYSITRMVRSAALERIRPCLGQRAS